MPVCCSPRELPPRSPSSPLRAGGHQHHRHRHHPLQKDLPPPADLHHLPNVLIPRHPGVGFVVQRGAVEGWQCLPSGCVQAGSRKPSTMLHGVPLPPPKQFFLLRHHLRQAGVPHLGPGHHLPHQRPQRYGHLVRQGKAGGGRPAGPPRLRMPCPASRALGAAPCGATLHSPPAALPGLRRCTAATCRRRST
jgi:hypothetical protein